jgi:hypothetical protein
MKFAREYIFEISPQCGLNKVMHNSTPYIHQSTVWTQTMRRPIQHHIFVSPQCGLKQCDDRFNTIYSSVHSVDSNNATANSTPYIHQSTVWTQSMRRPIQHHIFVSPQCGLNKVMHNSTPYIHQSTVWTQTMRRPIQRHIFISPQCGL